MNSLVLKCIVYPNAQFFVHFPLRVMVSQLRANFKQPHQMTPNGPLRPQSQKYLLHNVHLPTPLPPKFPFVSLCLPQFPNYDPILKSAPNDLKTNLETMEVKSTPTQTEVQSFVRFALHGDSTWMTLNWSWDLTWMTLNWFWDLAGQTYLVHNLLLPPRPKYSFILLYGKRFLSYNRARKDPSPPPIKHWHLRSQNTLYTVYICPWR